MSETEKINPESISIILATDCGSTTSKARLFSNKGGEYRFVASGEAPTTVEAPFEDVTLGVKNAVKEIEEITGHRILGKDGILIPSRGEHEGVDLYVTTSSAGGGLQMMVAGVAKIITAESAERAALGAGAIVLDVMAIDDGRPAHRKIERIRQLRPDMMLVGGGTDGGTIGRVVKICELIATAKPRARLGVGYELPIVYAGNKGAREEVQKLLSENFALKIVDNLRPTLDVENVEPARDAIHELFMEHVMSHAPGYDKLMKWTETPIMPTPAGEGRMFRTLAEMRNLNVVGVGLGGATTNIYSVYDGKFVRTVSANLGMSYSICNVLKETGIENILRWIPFDIKPAAVRNMLRNKMIRPTTIPQTVDHLVMEHAVARECLRLGFNHHKSLARSLRGVRRIREVSDVFNQRLDLGTYIDMLRVNLVAATGGLLSHAPRRVQTAMILIDGFQPEGVTRLAQDSVFMMPHLGVLSTVHPKAALEIFEKDCLVELGTCVAPKTESDGSGEEIARVEITMPDGNISTEGVARGAIRVLPLDVGQSLEAEVHPAKNCDVGAGPGHSYKTRLHGGAVGVILDGRGRPLSLPETPDERRKKLLECFRALNAYPKEVLDRYAQPV
jgi:uncharacterized protein (TIGR01319 family)